MRSCSVRRRASASPADAGSERGAVFCDEFAVLVTGTANDKLASTPAAINGRAAMFLFTIRLDSYVDTATSVLRIIAKHTVDWIMLLLRDSEVRQTSARSPVFSARLTTVSHREPVDRSRLRFSESKGRRPLF